MILGSYTFDWLPDLMTIPRPKKDVTIARNLVSAVAFTIPAIDRKSVV